MHKLVNMKLYVKNYSFVFFLAIAICLGCKKDRNPERGPIDPPKDIPDQIVKGWRWFTTANSAIGDDQVNAVAIDAQDVKWVGTAKGLVRIKGASIACFNPENSPIPSPYITSVAVDASGKVWVGTENGLLNYDGKLWNLYTKTNSSLPDNAVNHLNYDMAGKKIWVGTSAGIVAIDSDGNFTVETAKEGEHVYGLATDDSGVLWAATFDHTSFRGKIGRFDGQKWTGNRLSELGYFSAHPFAVAVDHQKRPYFAIGGTSVNAIIYLQGGSWVEVPIGKDVRGIKTLAFSAKGLWAGGRKLYLWNGILVQSYTPDGTDSPISAIAVDSKDNVWVGTVYGGLGVFSDL